MKAGQPVISDYCKRLENSCCCVFRCCTNFYLEFYEIYRHLGLENKSNTWHPTLYLTYSGVGHDVKVIFEDENLFDQSMKLGA